MAERFTYMADMNIWHTRRKEDINTLYVTLFDQECITKP